MSKDHTATEHDGPAYKAVASRIENMLANGELRPGDPLPNETELAAQFDVNRSTIRESIRLLEDGGYIKRISPRKLVASLPTPASLAERTSRALFITRATLRDVWEANLAIEPAMARVAAQRATDAQKTALRENIDATARRIERGEDLADLDEEFHALLGQASNQPALQIAREPFSALFLEVVDGLVHDLSVSDRLLVAHSRIVEAIERGDADVAELWTRRHTLDFERGCKLAGVGIDVPLDQSVLKASAA
ncbi:MAG: FCD domain-containing protein [Pseudomonadota bacterium]